MQVQFREQTPGVRAGEWWDAESGLHHSVVTIQSLDGWVAYVGDKRIGREFATHEDAADFAISNLKSQSLRRGVVRRFIAFGLPATAIALLAFVVHGFFYGDASTSEQIAAGGGATASQASTGTVTRAPAVRDSKVADPASSTTTNRATHVAAHANTAASIDKKVRSTKEELPQINEKRAISAPWEKSLSELAAQKSNKAANAKANPTLAGKPRKTAAIYTAVDSRPQSGSTAEEKQWDADLVADMRADEAERDTFIENEKPKATQARMVVDDEIPPDEEVARPAANGSSPITLNAAVKSANEKYRSKKKARKKAAAKRYRKRRARRRAASASPLVKKVVRKNFFGQRYVVYKARRPRNAREYRKLKRLRRKLRTQQRRRQRQYYGYGY